MLGLMQDWPLTVDKILDHAKNWHGDREVVTRSVEGPIVRTTYSRIHDRAKRVSNALKAWGIEPGDRVATLAGHFHKVGKRLDGTVAAYNDAVGSMESRVLVSARRFSELGAASSQAIPELEAVDHHARSLRAGELANPSAEQDGDDSEN